MTNVDILNEGPGRHKPLSKERNNGRILQGPLPESPSWTSARLVIQSPPKHYEMHQLVLNFSRLKSIQIINIRNLWKGTQRYQQYMILIISFFFDARTSLNGYIFFSILLIPSSVGISKSHLILSKSYSCCSWGTTVSEEYIVLGTGAYNLNFDIKPKKNLINIVLESKLQTKKWTYKE